MSKTNLTEEVALDYATDWFSHEEICNRMHELKIMIGAMVKNAFEAGAEWERKRKKNERKL